MHLPACGTFVSTTAALFSQSRCNLVPKKISQTTSRKQICVGCSDKVAGGEGEKHGEGDADEGGDEEDEEDGGGDEGGEGEGGSKSARDRNRRRRGCTDHENDDCDNNEEKEEEEEEKKEEKKMLRGSVTTRQVDASQTRNSTKKKA